MSRVDQMQEQAQRRVDLLQQQEQHAQQVAHAEQQKAKQIADAAMSLKRFPTDRLAEQQQQQQTLKQPAHQADTRAQSQLQQDQALIAQLQTQMQQMSVNWDKHVASFDEEWEKLGEKYVNLEAAERRETEQMTRVRATEWLQAQKAEGEPPPQEAASVPGLPSWDSSRRPAAPVTQVSAAPPEPMLGVGLVVFRV